MRPGFLNENLNRSYPFVYSPTPALPHYAVADFGSVMLAGSGYIEGEHTVYLHSAILDGDVVNFQFRSTAPGLTGYCLLFQHDATSQDLQTSFAEAIPVDEAEATVDSSSSLSVISSVVETCPANLLWHGFLTTGDLKRWVETGGGTGSESSGGFSLTELTALWPPFAEVQVLDGPFVVEPTRTHNCSQAYVQAVNLANSERTRATTREECRELCWSFPTYDHYVVSSCLTGPLFLEEGYNVSIRQDSLTNTITIEPGVNMGKGEPCEDVLLFATEQAPNGRTALDGALRCDEVVRSINGVGKRFFSISGGNGVTITPVPEQHKIIVSADLQNMAICPEVRDTGAFTSEIPDSPDPCDCGAA